MLQSGLHKQHMKDLFVELCLTVPVRLSSLLPYLPMLMDPLVSALNGSQTLVSQGLRTLELCVDNLQPDFLYDHIQPVRAELMQVQSFSFEHWTWGEFFYLLLVLKVRSFFSFLCLGPLENFEKSSRDYLSCSLSGAGQVWWKQPEDAEGVPEAAVCGDWGSGPQH